MIRSSAIAVIGIAAFVAGAFTANLNEVFPELGPIELENVAEKTKHSRTLKNDQSAEFQWDVPAFLKKSDSKSLAQSSPLPAAQKSSILPFSGYESSWIEFEKLESKLSQAESEEEYNQIIKRGVASRSYLNSCVNLFSEMQLTMDKLRSSSVEADPFTDPEVMKVMELSYIFYNKSFCVYTKELWLD